MFRGAWGVGGGHRLLLSDAWLHQPGPHNDRLRVIGFVDGLRDISARLPKKLIHSPADQITLPDPAFLKGRAALPEPKKIMLNFTQDIPKSHAQILSRQFRFAKFVSESGSPPGA